MNDTLAIKLTQDSYGAAGGKISPKILDGIFRSDGPALSFPGLLVGNGSKDDATVLEWKDEEAIISTTDFFIPFESLPVIS